MDEQCTSSQWGQSPYEVTIEFLSCFFSRMVMLRSKKSTGWTNIDLLFLDIENMS